MKIFALAKVPPRHRKTGRHLASGEIGTSEQAVAASRFLLPTPSQLFPPLLLLLLLGRAANEDGDDDVG